MVPGGAAATLDEDTSIYDAIKKTTTKIKSQIGFPRETGSL